jgi:polyhydroxybutyrate depolymerase
VRTPTRSSAAAALGAALVAACASTEEDDALPDSHATEPRPGAGESGTTTPPTKTPPYGSKGCSLAAKRGVAKDSSVDVGGDERTYVLSVPTAYDPYKAYPLVFVFHGSGGNAEGMRDEFGWSAIAEDKAIVVYPDGNDGRWDLDSPPESNADYRFFDALVAEIGEKTCVDRTRVFATGWSMGGYFSNQLGCRRGNVLRAIAPHAGGGPFGGDGAYDEEGHLRCGAAPAVMVFHGADDGSVDLSEGQTTVNYWAWAQGCASETAPTSPSPCVAYRGCKKPVIFCKVPGLDHGIWSNGPKATWDFFASF